LNPFFNALKNHTHGVDIKNNFNPTKLVASSKQDYGPSFFLRICWGRDPVLHGILPKWPRDECQQTGCYWEMNVNSQVGTIVTRKSCPALKLLYRYI
jgi:hypothetical protein